MEEDKLFVFGRNPINIYNNKTIQKSKIKPNTKYPDYKEFDVIVTKGDGNCLFNAMCFALYDIYLDYIYLKHNRDHRYGLHKISPSALRNKVWAFYYSPRFNDIIKRNKKHKEGTVEYTIHNLYNTDTDAEYDYVLYDGKSNNQTHDNLFLKNDQNNYSKFNGSIELGHEQLYTRIPHKYNIRNKGVWGSLCDVLVLCCLYDLNITLITENTHTNTGYINTYTIEKDVYKKYDYNIYLHNINSRHYQYLRHTDYGINRIPTPRFKGMFFDIYPKLLVNNELEELESLKQWHLSEKDPDTKRRILQRMNELEKMISKIYSKKNTTYKPPSPSNKLSSTIKITPSPPKELEIKKSTRKKSPSPPKSSSSTNSIDEQIEELRNELMNLYFTDTEGKSKQFINNINNKIQTIDKQITRLTEKQTRYKSLSHSPKRDKEPITDLKQELNVLNKKYFDLLSDSSLSDPELIELHNQIIDKNQTIKERATRKKSPDRTRNSHAPVISNQTRKKSPSRSPNREKKQLITDLKKELNALNKNYVELVLSGVSSSDKELVELHKRIKDTEQTINDVEQ
jgi:hypothetical protein